jgi:predicted TIM-barrel fold metal-dependent hydrolase
VLEVLMGDLLTTLPGTVNLTAADLLPAPLVQILEAFEQNEAEGNAQSKEQRDALAASFGFHDSYFDGGARLAWADEKGIDVQFMLPTMGHFPYRSAMRNGERALALEALRAYNTWAAGQLAPHTDRLIPVALVDLSDLDWALAELRRTRELGSRVMQIKGEPVGGKSLAHPDFEPLWATAEELGTTIMLHVGGGRAQMDPGWLDNGGAPMDFSLLYQAFVGRLVPELTLGALILRGVLERHPRLSFVIAELGYQWVPDFVTTLDKAVDQTSALTAFMGHDLSHLKLRPSEYFQRQVRVPVLASQPGLGEAIEQAPAGVYVFSSDYPHPEGTPDPVAAFEGELSGHDERTRQRFFGQSLGELIGV